MANDYTPKVAKVQEQPMLQPDGTVVNTVVVSYTIGAHGPFTASFVAKDFTADAARKVMSERAQTLQQLGA